MHGLRSGIPLSAEPGLGALTIPGYLRGLASYKVPRRVVFLRDDELSMTGSEKVKAGALRQLAAERLVAPPRT